MNVAFIKKKYVPFGGGEGYLDRLLHACRDKRHNVHLITMSWPGETLPDVEIRRVPGRPHPCINTNRWFAREVARIVNRSAFDLVLSLERTACQDVWRAGEGVHRVWLDRRKLFDHLLNRIWCEISPRQRALLELEAHCIRHTPCIIANSRMVKHDIETVYARVHGRIEVVYNGVDPRRYSLEQRSQNRGELRATLYDELPCGRAKKLLLFVGSGFVRKGLNEALRALCRLPDCALIVLGRDRSRSWQRKAAHLGLSDRVLFKSPRSDLRPWYQAADLTLLPSWFDSFALVGLESLFCGTPLLTTRFAGIHELIRKNENGACIEKPSDIDAMIQAVETLLAQRAAPEAIAASVNEYTMESNCRKTMDVLQNELQNEY